MPVLQMTMLGEVKYIAQEGLTALMSPGAGTGTGVWGRYPHLPWSDVRNHPLRTLPLHRPGLLPKPTSEAYLVGLVAQAHELAFLVHLLHGHAPAGASVLGEAAPALGGLQLALFGDAAPTLGLGRVGGGPASAALRGRAGGQVHLGHFLAVILNSMLKHFQGKSSRPDTEL